MKVIVAGGLIQRSKSMKYLNDVRYKDCVGKVGKSLK